MTSKKEPKISVVTICLNHGMFLEQAIKSVLEQEYRNFEYIIIDGGSTDQTIEILKKYEDKIKIWISEKDKGQSDAMNKALSYVSGDLIVYLNADDTLTQNIFTEITNQYEKNTILVGKTILCELNSGIEKKTEKPAKNLQELLQLQRFKMPLNAFCYYYPPEIHKTIGLFDVNEKYAMDYDFLIRAYEKLEVKVINEYFGRMNLGNQSLTSRKEIDDDYYHYKISKKYLKSKNINIFIFWLADRSARYLNKFDKSKEQTYSRIDVKIIHKFHTWFDVFISKRLNDSCRH